MARLYDSSMGPKGYSLANLTVSFEKKILDTKNTMIRFLEKELDKNSPAYQNLQVYKKNYLDTNYKKSMYKLFGRKKILKSGKEGKTTEIPPIVDLHTREDTVKPWVHYACLDAEITFFLRETLSLLLRELGTNFEGMNDMNDVYAKYWRPFGEMLTDMERIGIKVNKDHLRVSYLCESNNPLRKYKF
jgi:DNA polymerase-1